MTLREAKQHIRAYLQTAYSDEKLCQLLAHAQSGKLSFFSCCCLVGIPSADHALQGLGEYGSHYSSNDYAAEQGFAHFGHHVERTGDYRTTDALRRRRIIPIVLAEIRRRERLAHVNESLTIVNAQLTV